MAGTCVLTRPLLEEGLKREAVLIFSVVWDKTRRQNGRVGTRVPAWKKKCVRIQIEAMEAGTLITKHPFLAARLMGIRSSDFL